MILESLTCKSELSEILGAAMDDFDSDFTSDICLAVSLDQASPYHWSSKEVLDWVFKVAEQNCMDWKVLRAEAFKMKGSELCFKNRQEFINLDPTYGSILYESLQQLLEKYPTGSELPDLFNVDLPMFFDGMGTTDDMIIDNIPCEDTITDGRLPQIETFFKDRCPTADLGSILDSPISTESTLGFMSSQGSCDLGYESTGSSSDYNMYYPSSPQLPEVLNIYNNDDHHIQEFSHSPRMACSAVDYPNTHFSCHNATPTYPITLLTMPSSPSPVCASPLSVNSDSSFSSSGFDSPTSNPDSPRISNFSHHYDRHQISLPTGPRKPGRPRKQTGLCFPSTSVNKKNAMGSRKRPQGNKSTHLWEFMRTLLDDPAYNPSCIKWENEELGVFRIVPGRSQDIAKLWGERKNNITMTFDKLSRSLRWCRTYGFLAEVPKDKGYPKKLCFRFGAKALQWDKTKAMAIMGKC